jgi:Putative Ig domain
MTDKEFMLSCGPRLARLALVAALAVLTFAFVGDAGAHKPYPLSAPTIGANPVVGTPLGVAPGSYFCDPACTGTTYEFFRCAANTNNVSCVAVRPQSTNPFYTPTEDDIGFSLAAMVRQWTYDCNIKNEDCRNSAYEVMTSATAPVKEDAPPVPVTIATSELPDATAGIRYMQGLSVSSGKLPITWALEGGSLPPGLSLSSSGLISGAPTLAGKFSFTVRATGARKQSNTKQLELVVKLQLSPSSLPSPVPGRSYKQTVTVVAGGTPPYTWKLVGGVLPDGISFENGVFSGTPTRAVPSSVMVQITDARGAEGSYMWKLDVAWPQISVSPSLLRAARSGVPYRQVLAASGGKAPYAFMLISACSLPEGLRLTRGGVLAGTPTAAPGIYVFEVVVRDANGTPSPPTTEERYTRRYTLRIDGDGTRALRLMPAVAGKEYRWDLTVCDGHISYTFTVTGGQLPRGMRLGERGMLSGKPRQAGTYRFRIRAEDVNGLVIERSYQLLVDRA